MRDPSKSHSLIAPSIEEIHGALVHEAAPRIGRRAKFRGRKLYPGPLLNAIVLHFLSLPHSRQQEIAQEYLARYEALLRRDEPAGGVGVDAPANGLVIKKGSSKIERIVDGEAGCKHDARKASRVPKG